MGKIGAIIHIILGVGIYVALKYFDIFSSELIRILAAFFGFFAITIFTHRKK